MTPRPLLPLILLSIAALPCAAQQKIEAVPMRNAWEPQIFRDFKEKGPASPLYDFSGAGYRHGEAPIPEIPVTVNVRDFGAIPDDGQDDAPGINRAIEAAAAHRVGAAHRAGADQPAAVLLPAGRYDINVAPTSFSQISIRHGGIVLRGEGPAPEGTVLFLHHKMLKPDEYGTFLIHALGPEAGNKDARNITAPAPRGSRILTLDRTDALQPGDTVRILQFNPSDANGKRTDRLSRHIEAPLEPEPEWKYFARWAPFDWRAEIAETLDAHRVRLVEPLPMEISLEWNPQIRPCPMMSGVGIENLRLESAWEGGYSHHKNRDVDYAWAAVKLENIRDGWVRNVEIVNYTQDIALDSSKNCTVTGIRVSGHAGHHGMTTTGWHNLFDAIRYDAARTHSAGANGTAIGNVFRRFHLTAEGFLDMHGGGFPMCNLYENINNVRVAGAGATQNMPHAGPRNVFWNIVCGKRGRAGEDFFASGYWNYYDFYKKRGNYRNDCYKLYPQSIVMGCYAPNDTLRIEGSSSDRADPWITIEGLDRPGITPPSLYEAQTQLRRVRKP